MNNNIDNRNFIIIENEEEKFKKQKIFTLILLIIGFILNLVLFLFIDYTNLNNLITIVVLFLILICTFANIYSGFLMKEDYNKTPPLTRNIGMTNYYLTGLINFLLIPAIYITSTGVFQILFLIFIIYIHFLIYFPVVRVSYFYMRKVKNKLENKKITFFEYFRNITILNLIILLIDIVLMILVYKN